MGDFPIERRNVHAASFEKGDILVNLRFVEGDGVILRRLDLDADKFPGVRVLRHKVVDPRSGKAWNAYIGCSGRRDQEASRDVSGLSFLNALLMLRVRSRSVECRSAGFSGLGLVDGVEVLEPVQRIVGDLDRTT